MNKNNTHSKDKLDINNPSADGEVGLSIYEKSYPLITYDLDPNGNLRIDNLLAILQDASTLHYMKVVSEKQDDHAFETQGIWVLLSWNISMKQRLRTLGTLRVVTMPVYMKKFIAYRRYDFYIGNEMVGTAMTKWTIIDPVKRSMTSIHPDLIKAFGLDIKHQNTPEMSKPEFSVPSELILEYAFSEDFKLGNQVCVTDNDDGSFSLGEVLCYSYPQSLSDDGMHTHSFCSKRNIMYSDTDMNNHVNNISYYKWVLDTLGYDFNKQFYPDSIDIVYKKEMKHTDAVAIITRHKVSKSKENTCEKDSNIEDGNKIKNVTHTIDAIVFNANSGEECVKVRIIGRSI